MLIKNGKVVIFENDDVKVKDLDIRIKGKLIHEMDENLEPEANEKVLECNRQSSYARSNKYSCTYWL